MTYYPDYLDPPYLFRREALALDMGFLSGQSGMPGTGSMTDTGTPQELAAMIPGIDPGFFCAIRAARYDMNMAWALIFYVTQLTGGTWSDDAVQPWGRVVDFLPSSDTSIPEFEFPEVFPFGALAPFPGTGKYWCNEYSGTEDCSSGTCVMVMMPSCVKLLMNNMVNVKIGKVTLNALEMFVWTTLFAKPLMKVADKTTSTAAKARRLLVLTFVFAFLSTLADMVMNILGAKNVTDTVQAGAGNV